MEYLKDNVDEAISAFNAIEEKIVETGVEVEEGTRPRMLANKIPQVYEAGKKAEYDAFWDMFQNNGTRGDYGSAFINWSAEYIHPKYKAFVTNVSGARQMFYVCTNLKKVEADYFDFSQKPQDLTSASSNYGYSYTFATCSKLEEIEDIGMIAQNIYSYTFGWCHKLHTIAKMGVDEATRFTSAFIECDALENLTIEGTIGQNGFDIHWSTKLSAKSLKSIIDALSTTKTGLTVTLPSTAEANYNANPPEGAPATWLELVGDGTEEHLGIRPNWTIAYA